MMDVLTCFVAVAVHAKIGAPGNSVCRLDRERYAGLQDPDTGHTDPI